MSITYTNTPPERCAFAALLDSAGWFRDAPLTLEQLDQALEATWASASAYDGDLLVGYGRILSDGVIHALIVEMIVLPQYQGQGIGSTILERLVARCQEAGIRSIQLFAARDRASFYERHGFARRAPDAPGMELPRR